MSRSIRFLLVLAVLGFAVQQASADVYVVRVGAGAAALTNTPVAVETFIDKYSDAGSLLTTYPLPTTASGSNRPLTLAINSTSVGHLSLSTDSQYLMLGGYDADAGTAGVRVGTANRTIGRITLAGAIDTTTSLTDAYPGSTGNNGDIRSVVSTNGTDFWASGTTFPTTGGQGGVQYAALGATTGIRLASTPTNVRNANIFNGQLYVSSASGAFVGISTVGTGLPVPAGDDLSTTTLVVGTGVSGSGNASPYDFWFQDANTVYVADDRTAATGGGIQKWTFDGAAWSLAYTLNSGLTSGLRGLDGTIVGGNPVFYATTAPSTTDGTVNNAIVTVTDTGAASAFSTVATAATNTTVRGIVYVSAPAGIVGDYNGNGIVDGADYVVWRNGGSPDSSQAGYDLWRSKFGNTSGSGSGLSGSAVPEPATAMLLLLGLAAFVGRRRAS